MVSLYPSDFYANMFHPIIAAGNYKSRLMIYSIDLAQNPIDVDSRAQVEYYAELLTYKNTDTDSNRRISQNGIKLNNYYNKDEQYAIGNAPVASIEISFINDDGFFSTYDWEQTIIVYWDLWDNENQMWIGCPIGVYWWERPAKTSAVIVSATAYDGMYRLDQYTSWSWPTFENGSYTLGTVYTSLVSNIAGILPYATPEDWPNMTVTIDSAPFDVTNMTNREILAKLAEIAGSNVFASRDGRIKMKPFTDAYWKPAPQAQPTYYELDGDSLPTPITKIEIGEYTVPSITQFIAQVGQTGKEFIVGSGTQTMYSINNGFLAVDDAKANQMITTMLGVVSGTDASSDMVPYAPLYIRAYADPTVEAGDVIRVIRNETTYLMPVFQQTLYWNGADWIVEMQNSGYANRTIPSEAERASYVVEDRLSQLEPHRGGDGRSDSTPYYFRRSGGGITGSFNRENDKLIGGTVAWNQLVQSGTTAVTIPNGHVYSSVINNLREIKVSDGSPISINNSSKDIVSDLTVMFGSDIANYIYSLPSGRGAWLQSYGFLTKYRYGYDAGTIVSVQTNAHNIVGFNQYRNGQTVYKAYLTTDNKWRQSNDSRSIAIRCLPNTQYYVYRNGISTSNNLMRVGDISEDNLPSASATGWSYTLGKARVAASGYGVAYTTTSSARWLIVQCGQISFDSGATPNALCISFYDNAKNGTYEPYDGNSYPLDSDLVLRGIPKLDANNKLYYDGDEYAANGTVTRKYAVRAYQSGDATDGSTMITDGTNTVYKLATPTTETADSFTNPQVVDASGTEQYVDAAYTAGTRDFEMPVGHYTEYYELKSDAQQIYDTPSADGTYRLVCKVLNGTTSFEWVPA